MLGKYKYFNQRLVNKLECYLAPFKSQSLFNKTPFPRTTSLLCECSSNAPIKTTKYKTSFFEFSDEEQSKILQVLNNESEEFFERLNIPRMQVNKLKVWQTKKGPHKSIHDVLDVEGIDIKNLIKICQSIAMNKPISQNRKQNILKKRQFTSPALSGDIVKSLTSTVGLHLGPAGVSWAHISCLNRKLNDWGSKNFSELPMKVSSWENFELAIQILNDIPPADLYVLETQPGLNLQPQSPAGTLSNYKQQIELISMLFALLNTSKKHNKGLGDNIKDVNNIVYNIRAKLPARLFKTLVGNEKVSTISSVRKLFNYDECESPCSPIEIDQTLINFFENQTSSNQELMGHSLLLAITFLDLCVYKSVNSLKVLNSQYGKKESPKKQKEQVEGLD